jgi:hypothetical protein
MKNTNTQITCECAQTVGLVLDTLVLKGHVSGSQALASMEILGPCTFFDDEVHSSAVNIARVMIHALEELWLDIDEAISMMAFLTDIEETAALQLLV